jgi:hypothetical protein
MRWHRVHQSFGRFLNRLSKMIELKARRTKIGAIRCSGRASDVTGSPAPFAIVSVELLDSNNPSAPFEVEYDDPECVNQSGEKYANLEEEKFFVAGAARGVKDAASHYESLGIGLHGLKARVVRLVAHEVDSSERAFWLAAKNAMAACLVNIT